MWFFILFRIIMFCILPLTAHIIEQCNYIAGICHRVSLENISVFILSTRARFIVVLCFLSSHQGCASLCYFFSLLATSFALFLVKCEKFLCAMRGQKEWHNCSQSRQLKWARPRNFNKLFDHLTFPYKDWNILRVVHVKWTRKKTKNKTRMKNEKQWQQLSASVEQSDREGEREETEKLIPRTVCACIA